MKTVDIVIPLFNGKTTINACLDGILGQRIPTGWNINITVVDDQDQPIRFYGTGDFEIYNSTCISE